MTVGSGFLANIALIEALVRKGDCLFLDEEFHASGVLAARLVDRAIFFRHNDPEDLAQKLARTPCRRAIVAVEGIYSMSGDLLDREIFEVAEAAGALLVVDEAHSVGVVGERLLGVFDLFGITPAPWHVKMGTMGKALGSYGAYILASEEIIHFLENRAKSVIYTTALSLMDVALAHEGLLWMERRAKTLGEAIALRRQIVGSFGFDMPGLIVDIPCREVLEVQERLMGEGYLVGAIRPPTVKSPMIRVIARLGEEAADLEALMKRLGDVCL